MGAPREEEDEEAGERAQRHVQQLVDPIVLTEHRVGGGDHGRVAGWVGCRRVAELIDESRSSGEERSVEDVPDRVGLEGARVDVVSQDPSDAQPDADAEDRRQEDAIQRRPAKTPSARHLHPLPSARLHLLEHRDHLLVHQVHRL
jgi:hypothetical protein